MTTATYSGGRINATGNIQAARQSRLSRSPRARGQANRMEISMLATAAAVNAAAIPTSRTVKFVRNATSATTATYRHGTAITRVRGARGRVQTSHLLGDFATPENPLKTDVTELGSPRCRQC